MVVTDFIATTEGCAACPNIRTISIAPLLGEAMRRINNEASRFEPVRLAQRHQDQAFDHRDGDPMGAIDHAEHQLAARERYCW